MDSSLVLTVYDAIWEDLPVATRCRSCSTVQHMDPRRLAIDGHGQSRLAHVPFSCDCGSTEPDVFVG